ncbi:putative DUR3-urea permease [Tilletiaria anomala UBC 951]|uniref:Putative DUR3-urea permease n=1 Tax=Tilletiaria anomala (strain ATCC 24038 / CBS 436.72 / UBC 951) TaxID=1037660 RepID=A0A066V6T6_TILAU|nr:putative DUR3-urea permease [Tilletiaria anomala UBC 951]KDN37457.1 putative DUR3-urea permease [Tilletiaria anomala UBC 951]
MSDTLPPPPLSQGTGYGVVVGLGFFFAVVVIGVSRTLIRFAGIQETSEEFSVATRSLGKGLVASAAVSSWIWSVTLLSSCSTAYNYGAAGAFMYAAGNTTQIALFALLAVQIKRKAPTVHTHLELVKLRFPGIFPHLTFMFFALATNILVSAAVLLGASAAINAITGTNIYANIWLLSAAVVSYTVRGGLRSVVIADYLHTCIILIILFIFWLRTYTTLPEIGSPSKMYDLLQNLAVTGNGIKGNFQESLLTIKSPDAIKFGVLSWLEYTGVVFNDASFFQKGIAAKPSAAMPGYVIAALSWFPVPWALATTAGLVARALETTSPRFPTFPNKMTTAEISAGLTLPYAGQAILGNGGSAAVLLLMFMSSTSALSAQLVGVSTVLTFDVYNTYINKKATARQTLLVNHFGVVGFGIFASAFSSLLHGVGVDLSIIYNITGIFTCSALPQLLFIFSSAGFPNALHSWAVFPGIWIDFGAAVGVWLGTAYRTQGAVNITTLANVSVCLYGCIAAVSTGLILCTIASLINGEQFDWDTLKVKQADSYEGAKEVLEQEQDVKERRQLDSALKLGAIFSVTIFLVLFIIWPYSLYRDYIFTRSFFSGWSIVAFIWAVISFVNVGILPLYEGIPLFNLISSGIYNRLRGRPAPSSDSAEDPASTGASTPLGEKEGSASSPETEYTGPGSANKTVVSVGGSSFGH